MRVEVITIGDEILIGQITDTNSRWIGQQLNNNGFFSLQFTSIGDDRELILRTLKNAEEHADVILITGGLGPTKDDITKNDIVRILRIPHWSTMTRSCKTFAAILNIVGSRSQLKMKNRQCCRTTVK